MSKYTFYFLALTVGASSIFQKLDGLVVIEHVAQCLDLVGAELRFVAGEDGVEGLPVNDSAGRFGLVSRSISFRVFYVRSNSSLIRIKMFTIPTLWIPTIEQKIKPKLDLLADQTLPIDLALLGNLDFIGVTYVHLNISVVLGLVYQITDVDGLFVSIPAVEANRFDD